MEKKNILVLGIIPLLVLSFVGPPASAQASASHDVTESQKDIQISNSNPIPYYPGVLIGMPQVGAVISASSAASSSFGSDQIAIGEGTISASSGTYKVVIITDVASGSQYEVGIGTIIVQGSDGTYQSAETDVYIQNQTSAQGMFTTQEHIYQTTPETLVQHYDLLANAMAALSTRYASEGAPHVSSAYSHVVAQLHGLSSIILTRYPAYDKAISIPRGVITLNIVPDDEYECAQVSLNSLGSNGNSIMGEFSSWFFTSPHQDQIQFSGTIGFSAGSSNYQAGIQDPPLKIAGSSIVPAWGGAQYDYVNQQNLSTSMSWTIVGGLPGGWDVVFDTGWGTAPSPAYVWLLTQGESEGAANLAVC